MITTEFLDLNDGNRLIKRIPYEVSCQRGDYVDFDVYDRHSDYDIYIVKNIIFLPNEAKKIVELKLSNKSNESKEVEEVSGRDD